MRLYSVNVAGTAGCRVGLAFGPFCPMMMAPRLVGLNFLCGRLARLMRPTFGPWVRQVNPLLLLFGTRKACTGPL